MPNSWAVSTSAWNSLEVVKILVGILTPVVLILLGILVSRAAHRIEHAEWANRVLIERRLELYDKMGPLLNDVYCFFGLVGHFRDLKPAEILERKRTLDATFHLNKFLFTPSYVQKYDELMNGCFKTYAGAGKPAKLRGRSSLHQRERGKCWEEGWEEYFASDEEATSPGTVGALYEELMNCFARDIGVKPD